MQKSAIALFCSFIILVFSNFNYQTPNTKTMIIGTWAFERMEFTGEFAKLSEYMKQEAIENNLGVVLQFASDNKYKASRKKDNREEILQQGEYKISQDGKTMIIIDTDKKEESGSIVSITKDTLKLSSPETPIMVLKKMNP